MPTFNTRGSNSKNFRKDSNDRVAAEAVKGDLEDATFGRVIKHLGNGRLQVLLPNKTERQAVIRGLLRRRRVTPIQTGDVVVLGERSFAAEGSTGRDVYDVMAVMTRRDAARMVREKTLPDWMLDDVGGGGAGEDFDFDYEGAGGAAGAAEGAEGQKEEEEGGAPAAPAAAAAGPAPAPGSLAKRAGHRTAGKPANSDNFNIDDI